MNNNNEEFQIPTLHLLRQLQHGADMCQDCPLPPGNHPCYRFVNKDKRQAYRHMKAGFSGTFVISWSQTEVDGLEMAPLDALEVGAAWSWHGEVVRVDGPSDVLRLDGADGYSELRRRAARRVRQLVGAAVEGQDWTRPDADADDQPDCGFVVTNGAQSFTVTVISAGAGRQPLLMFLDELPPKETELWVVHHALGPLSRRRGEDEAGVICFTPGTRIATPEGPQRIEDLREGDQVLTRDNGPQAIQWKGARHMTGARLYAKPYLRPIRIGAGAFGIDRPNEEFLVSPEHRMLIKGAAAQALFNCSEVLVSARDLVNGRSIAPDLNVRAVTYIHLLLPRHEVIWANGVETESFHPASADLDCLGEFDRIRLQARFPELEQDPQLYGAFARRSLTPSEAAILRYEAA